MNIKTLTLAVSLAFAGLSATANDFKPNENIVASVNKLTGGSTKATVNYFPGPNGLTGIGITSISGTKTVIFADSTGAYLFSGPAFDAATLEPINNSYLHMAPEPNVELAYNAVANTSAITVGSTAKDAEEYWVFADPNCGYCYKTHLGFRELLAQGANIRVNWVMVGILGGKSETVARGLLANGSAEDLEKYFATKSYTPAADVIARGADKEGANKELFRAMGFNGVPAVISFPNKQMSVVRSVPNFNELAKRYNVAFTVGNNAKPRG